MNRRKFITAFGTIAIGTGTALGTGAFSATTSSSEAAMSIVTSEDAELNVNKGQGTDSDNIQDGLYESPQDIDFDDLPVAAVADAGPMVNIQVFVAPDSSGSFDEIIEITNNDDVDYNVGFQFSQFGSAVGNGSNGISESTIRNDIFKFYEGDDTDGTVLSPNDGDMPNSMMITTGSTQQVTIGFDTTTQSQLSKSAGDFGSDNATLEDLVTEITAVANQTTN